MNDITSYITKSYSISENNFSPRKCYNIHIKNHLFTNFNTPEKFSHPLHLALPVFIRSNRLRKFVVSKTRCKVERSDLYKPKKTSY